MMNLEMLNWVSQNGGDKKFQEMAVTHSNTTMKNHFRPDYSSYHVLDYDLNTGEVIKEKPSRDILMNLRGLVDNLGDYMVIQ
jgi:hypothetical protein